MRETRHHTIVVVDVEGFGDQRRTNLHQRAVRDGLYQIVRKAFDGSGVSWDSCYREDRGDAVFLLASAEADKAVFVETVPPLLVTGLRVHNDTHPAEQRIRLRMALHAGEVAYDEHGVTSASLTLAFRLNDASDLKAALASSPGVLAVIASSWFFDDVVRHTPGAAPATWRAVEVAVKETTTIGWLTLPDHPYPPDTAAATLPSAPNTLVAVPWSAGVSKVVPRQLPAAVRDFTGRADYLDALDALLPSDLVGGENGDEREAAVVISAVDGCGGMGKTTLAVHWAHRVQPRFPDGTLHVNLRGYGPGDPATPSEVLTQFLRALDVPDQRIPTSVDAQSAMFRSLLAGRRMLLVLDNAHHPDQVRPLLPGTAGCMVLVTSRASLTGLVVTEAAHRLTLDLLTPAEASELVTGIIGPDRTRTEPDAIGELIRLCARLPLALRIAASHVAANPHTTVAELVVDLADDHTRLDTLSPAGDERAAIRTVFDWSYHQLPADQARLFRRLGLHPGPDISLPAAAAVAELAPAATRPLLAALTEARLINPAPNGRYRLHDLLRAYAADQAEHHDSASDRHQALDSLFTWYAHTAQTAQQQAVPAFTPYVDTPPEPAHPHPIHNSGQAWNWYSHERINLLAAVHHASRHQMDRHTLQLAISCGCLRRLGDWQGFVAVTAAALAAARRSGHRTYEGWFLCRQGDLARDQGQWEKARGNLDRAATLARETSNATTLSDALNGFGLLSLGQHRFTEALQYFFEMLPLTRGVDTGRMEAVAEGNISAAHTGLGQYQDALDHGHRSLALRRQAGDIFGEAGTLVTLAQAWQGLEEYNKANTLCQEALTILRDDPSPYTVARSLDTLATSLHHLGRTSEAIPRWQQAATLYEEQGRSVGVADVRERLRIARATLNKDRC